MGFIDSMERRFMIGKHSPENYFKKAHSISWELCWKWYTIKNKYDDVIIK